MFFFQEKEHDIPFNCQSLLFLFVIMDKISACVKKQGHCFQCKRLLKASCFLVWQIMNVIKLLLSINHQSAPLDVVFLLTQLVLLTHTQVKMSRGRQLLYQGYKAQMTPRKVTALSTFIWMYRMKIKTVSSSGITLIFTCKKSEQTELFGEGWAYNMTVGMQQAWVFFTDTF